MLMNNRINGLQEIDNLASLPKLELLSLLENPVFHLPKYRSYVIFKIPSLKCLDFQKVKQHERLEANRFFNSPEGVSFLASVAAGDKSTRAGGADNRASHNTSSGGGGGSAPTPLTDEQKGEVRRAIESATTREQVDKIERQLKVGDILIN
jgi:U2 small nuclear ribonucleoprotein A'